MYLMWRGWLVIGQIKILLFFCPDLVFVTLLTNTASESVLKWEEFHADTTFTVGDLRKNIACQWGLDEASLYLIIEMPGETLFMLMDPSELLTGLVSTKIHRVRDSLYC